MTRKQAADKPDRKPDRKTEEIVVFQILRESTCSVCGSELGKGSLLMKEGDGALCLSCADLDHLEFLPRGSAALTMRARKHSDICAVVVRFSRARKRYERQGLLVQCEALERAESECLADADSRARARERSAERRARLDTQYVAAFAAEIGRRYPHCPPASRSEIAEHAFEKYSGRVGRSAGAKALDAQAVDLAVRAHVRHRHTPYDRLMNRGWDRSDARAEVALSVEQVLGHWRASSQSCGDAPLPVDV